MVSQAGEWTLGVTDWMECREVGNTHLGRVGGDFEGVHSVRSRRGPLAPWLAATNLGGKERAGWHSDFLWRSG